MTRGRKKDLTIPPSRSLTQQRDYRARKAHYVSELEAHCRRVEEENAALRKELAETKARLANPVVVLPETAQASQELLYNLAMTSVSLTKFQQLAFPNVQPLPPNSFHGSNSAHGIQLPHPPAPANAQDAESQSQPLSQPRIGRKRLFTESEQEPPFSPSIQAVSRETSRSASSEESCCGGYVDCDALSGDGILEHKDKEGKISRDSGMRSTFDYRLETP